MLNTAFTIERNYALVRRYTKYFSSRGQKRGASQGVEAPWGARCLVLIGGVLGHVPFCRPWHPDPPKFTWLSFKALYSITLDTILTVVAIVELVDRLISTSKYKTGQWVVHVWPEVVLQVTHVCLVIVSLPEAPQLAKLLRKINRLHHPSGSLISFITFFLWIFNALATILKIVYHFEYKGKGIFYDAKGFIYFISSIYSRIYMTWPAAFIMQVCLSVKSCLRSSRDLVQELANSSAGEKVDFIHLEDVRLWHRHLSEYNHTLVEIASPVILVMAAEFYFSFPPHLYYFIVQVLLGGELKAGDPLAIADLFYIISLLGLVVALVLVVSSVVKEYYDVKLNLLTFPTYGVPRMATDQLLAFDSQLRFHDPAYTAMGFFNVTKTNLLKLGGAITVYMLILVPFHDRIDHDHPLAH